MKIKHSNLEIPQNNPFENCKLSRKKYADILTNIVNSYPDGFVLAINNRWGTGKTTFVKMWQQELNILGHKTIYFNAWENDFEDNPLTALMGELQTITTGITESKFKDTLKKAATISKHILPIIAQSIAEKYIDSKSLKEAIKGVSEGLADVFENEVKEYAEKKKGTTEFKKSLSEFIASSFGNKPLIFIVDELDRCRPNYAISIIEQIKHFFVVPNIVFILSIDKEQLGNAVKGVYGCELIDSDEYLKKFIDLEYSIPEQQIDIYYKYLFEFFEFKDFFESRERNTISDLRSDSSNFLNISNILFSDRNISLRQQEKIFALSRTALRSFRSNEYVVPQILLFLSFIKITQNVFYNNLKNKKLTITQTQEEFLKIIQKYKTIKNENELIVLEAYLLNYYSNYISTDMPNIGIYQYNFESHRQELVITSIVSRDKSQQLKGIIEEINKGQREGRLNLGYFISRLELIEDIKT